MGAGAFTRLPVACCRDPMVVHRAGGPTMADDKKSAPITKRGEQVGTFVPNKQGGMIVDRKGGLGSEGYKGSVKIPPKK